MKFYYSYIFLAIALFSNNLFSQIQFEQGYYIDVNGNKRECFIENKGWDKNPIEFRYKLSENSEVNVITAKSAIEVAVPDKFKYINRRVDVNTASKVLKRLSTTETIEIEKKQVFLKVLIEGKASLHSLFMGRYTNYFIQLDNGDIELLRYKKYSQNDEEIKTNE